MTSDPWCVCLDVGQFDQIYNESHGSRAPCEAYVRAHGHLFYRPLQIMRKSEVRQMIFYESEFAIGIEIQGPGSDREMDRI